MSTICITPYCTKDSLTGESMSFPCGKCPPCKKRRASSWSFRLLKHSDSHFLSSPLFVTLTYSTDNVPISENGYMTLSRRDVPLFIKRLRKLTSGSSTSGISYYYVGEYGTRKKRPHYHVLIFGASVKNIERAWCINNKPIGYIHFGNVEGASVGYCLKYMCKEPKVGKFKRDDRVKEFSSMSKGIGYSYLTDSMVRWHKADLFNRLYVPLVGGEKAPMPRYYKDKIYTDKERALISAHFKKCPPLVVDNRDARLIVESHKYQFSLMYKNAEKGRNL